MTFITLVLNGFKKMRMMRDGNGAREKNSKKWEKVRVYILTFMVKVYAEMSLKWRKERKS